MKQTGKTYVFHSVETHRLFGKEIVLGTAASGEGYTDSVLEYEKNHPLKISNCKKRFLMVTP